jgi:hypothetical protein
MGAGVSPRPAGPGLILPNGAQQVQAQRFVLPRYKPDGQGGMAVMELLLPVPSSIIEVQMDAMAKLLMEILGELTTTRLIEANRGKVPAAEVIAEIDKNLERMRAAAAQAKTEGP